METETETALQEVARVLALSFMGKETYNRQREGLQASAEATASQHLGANPEKVVLAVAMNGVAFLAGLKPPITVGEVGEVMAGTLLELVWVAVELEKARASSTGIDPWGTQLTIDEAIVAMGEEE